MKFFALATLFATLATAVDWRSSTVLNCASKEWSAIQRSVSPLLQNVWSQLPQQVTSQLVDNKLVKDDHSLIDNPSQDQIKEIARYAPSRIFYPQANRAIEQCLRDAGYDTDDDGDNDHGHSDHDSDDHDHDDNDHDDHDHDSDTNDNDTTSSASVFHANLILGLGLVLVLFNQ